jgi:hypothetical protein
MRMRDGIVLDHLDRLTDSTGLIQHAIYGVPRRDSGYTTDDNARALRLCTRLWELQPDVRLLNRVTLYLSFLEYARNATGGFHNFMSYQRQWLDEAGTGDCQGQAIRALAEVFSSNLPDNCRALAGELIETALPTLGEVQGLRAQAYLILALGQLWRKRGVGFDLLEKAARTAAQHLVERYRSTERPDWQWFEPCLTYANAVLPHALFVAGELWPKKAYVDVAAASFAFLNGATTADGMFVPVGNNGWFPQDVEKALYDQQPLEAATMVDAAATAFTLYQDDSYLSVFHRAHDWFHGQNTLGQSLVDVGTGACYDGLQPTGVNRNQGAESTLAYLWTEVHTYDLSRPVGEKREAVFATA